MSKLIVAAAVLAGSVATIGFLASPASTLRGKAEVIDGDTIRLAGERVRLLSLDAPELGQPCLRPSGIKFDCGQLAKAELQQLLTGHTVTCHVQGHDRYQRKLATCYVADTDISWWMIARGYAISTNLKYDGAEEKAIAARRGLWAGTFTDPIQFRRQRP
jgi:endonuclease YncB( thermonuclease family)